MGALGAFGHAESDSDAENCITLKGFSNRIESEGLFRTSGNSRSLFLRFLALVEVFDDFSPQNRIQHVELL